MSASREIPAIAESESLGVCCGCTLLCDDVTIRVTDSGWVSSERVCELGNTWLHRITGRPGSCRVAGTPTTEALALEACSRSLKAAKRPLLVGLDQLSVPNQMLAVKLARKLGAAIDLRLTESGWGDLLAFQNDGRVTASLGEIRQRSDTIVFWNTNPFASHPRFVERFCGQAKHLIFVYEGQAPAIPRSSTIDQEIHFVHLSERERSDCLTALRLEGVRPRPEPCDSATARDGNTPTPWSPLRERIHEARHLAVCHTAAPPDAGMSEETLSLHHLIRQRNEVRPAVLISLRQDANGQGGENALAAECGFARGVDFSTGRPRAHWAEFSAKALLTRGEVDVVLLVTDGTGPNWEDFRALCPSTQWLVWHTNRDSDWQDASVSIPIAAIGYDQAGDVVRNDDLLIPTDVITSSTRSQPERLLQQLLQT